MRCWKGSVRTIGLVVLLLSCFATACHAGPVKATEHYKVLSPITHGNLTVFPVLASDVFAADYLTLDEGLRSGEVIVTEAGSISPLIRRRPQIPVNRGDQVNRLVLVNNSSRPLLLLAGEVVTGGKQDRVIGKDRLVPPKSDPVDLSVFCVEPGRWVERSTKFGGLNGQMAQPTIRFEAMKNKDQRRVWAKVGENNRSMGAAVPSAAPVVGGTTSFAGVMEDKRVREHVDNVAKPIQESYASTIAKLREQNAVGVIVAVNGQIVWADLFANSTLLEKYWPKLVRSYAAESIVAGGSGSTVTLRDAERFLSRLDGKRAVVETEPGVYRHSEISGDDYTVFELTSLMGKETFDVHVAKLGGTDEIPVVGSLRR